MCSSMGLRSEVEAGSGTSCIVITQLERVMFALMLGPVVMVASTLICLG